MELGLFSLLHIHVSTSSLFMTVVYSVVWINHILFIHSFIHLFIQLKDIVLFPRLAIMSNATTNICTPVFVWTYVFYFSWVSIYRCRIANNSIFNIWETAKPWGQE